MQLSIERLLRKLTGSLLWAVSAILSIVLFFSFSDKNWIRTGVLILMAIGLEGAKILTWKHGGRHRVLACILLGLSVLASFGSALQTVRLSDSLYISQQAASEQIEIADNLIINQIDELTRQIWNLEKRITDLPENWLTWYRTLSGDLQALRAERQVLINLNQPNQTIDSVPSDKPFTTIFAELAKFTRWNRQAIELVVLMTIAICLEWGALALLGNNEPPKTTPVNVSDINLTDQASAFLEKMIELGDGHHLAGRDRVVKALEISDYQGKLCFKELVQTGRIQKSGKRMSLT